MFKICFKCKKIKKINLFYIHKQMGDGHLNKCIKCTKKDVNERYNNPIARKRIDEYERKRFKDPKRKEKIKIYVKRRKAKSPGKTKSRWKLAVALRNKTIKKLPCEKCGEIKSEAHHSDYRKHLQVNWLCKKHHWEEHKKMKK